MPDAAPMLGVTPPAPALPTGLPAQPVQPGPPAEVAAAAGPVDLVSLSPAALLQQALDAPGAAVHQLGSLLREVEQINQLTSRAAPLVMGEIAAEIGAAAGGLSAGVQALLPPRDRVPNPLQLATAAALHVLGPTQRQAGSKGADPAPQVSPDIGDPPAAGRAAEGELPVAGPNHGTPLVDPGREAQAAARAILRRAADTLGRMQSGMEAAAAAAAGGQSAAIANAPGPERDRAWCEAQIALAQAQVARASRAIESRPPAASGWRRMAASPDQRGTGSTEAAGRHGWPGKAGPWLMLLCLAAAALWAASRLDLTLARVAAAFLLALVGLAWIGRRSASRRLPRLRVEPRR